MNATESLAKFLSNLGARKRGDKYILDGFDGEFYLIFGVAEDPETPDATGTADIYIADIGSHPQDSETKTRVVTNDTRYKVLRFMLALGVERFSEVTRQFLYESNRVLRAD